MITSEFSQSVINCSVVSLFIDSFVMARTAVPKFLEDSSYDTEKDIPKKRKRIRPCRLDSTSSEEDLLVAKRTKASIPAPPQINLQAAKAGRKGQGPSKSELSKLARQEVMKRLTAARAAAAAKMSGSKSAWEVTVSLVPINSTIFF